MHRFATFLASCLLVALVAPVAAAEGTRTLGDRTFVKEGKAWTQIDPNGDRFEVNSRVITVKFVASASAVQQAALVEALGGHVLRRARTGFVDIEIPARRDVFDAFDAYRASELVAVVEPTTIGRYTVIPNDPVYGSQWHHPIVDAPTAWDTTPGAPNAVIAVLDSGTDFTHNDLGTGADGYQNIWLNAGEDAWTSPNNPNTGNGVDDDRNGFIDDWKGWNFDDNDNDPRTGTSHGTQVAGMSAAKTNNGTAVAGIAGGFGSAGSRIMIGAVGGGGPNGAVLDDAVLYAVDNGAQIVQMSLTVGTSAALEAAFQAAWDAGLVLICASGNGGGPNVSYPASNPNIIAVGATTSGDVRAGFSQHGPLLEVSAPGLNVVTLTFNNGTTTTTGTSFSAPLTSGVVALMLSANPNLTNAQIRQVLHDSADKVGGYDYNWNPAMPGHSRELGYGRVNAAAAVAMVSSIFADGFESGDTSAWTTTVP